MDRMKKEAVWKDFWSAERTRSTPAVVSTDWDAITRAQFDVWGEFLKEIGKGACVLDVATGAGKVPRMMHTVRPDLELIGIDIAESFPAAQSGVRLIGGVHMEGMPFEDARFDVVVSQFGFEYGDTDAGAKEILRVLKPGGVLGLMIHRSDGPIVAHNRKRGEQIAWLLEQKQLFKRMSEMIPADSSVSQNAYEFALSLATEGERQFGCGSAAWEIPEAVRRTLIFGANGSRAKLIETLGLIEEQAKNEVGRIQSLLAASAAADERETLLRGFALQGRKPVRCIGATLPGREVFADLIVL